MNGKVAHIAHHLPGDIRIFKCDVIGDMAGSFTDDNKVANNSVNCPFILASTIYATLTASDRIWFFSAGCNAPL